MFFLAALTLFTLLPVQWAYTCGIPSKCKCYPDLGWAICSQKDLTAVPLFTLEEYKWITSIDLTDNLLKDFNSLNLISNMMRHWKIYARGNSLDCATIANYSQLIMDYPCARGSLQTTSSSHVQATNIISALETTESTHLQATSIISEIMPNITSTENDHTMNYLALGLALFTLCVLVLAAIAMCPLIRKKCRSYNDMDRPAGVDIPMMNNALPNLYDSDDSDADLFINQLPVVRRSVRIADKKAVFYY